MARRHGLRIDYLGGWNERGLDPSWFVRFKRALRKEFPRVRLVADDNRNYVGGRITSTLLWSPVNSMTSP